MIHSMTGFGKADGIIANKKISIQLKSLNSKQSDISAKTPSIFRDMELSFRKQIADKLIRGKIELSINYENLQAQGAYELNVDLLKNYIHQLKAVKEDLNLEEDSLMAIATRFPEILKSQSEDFSESDKKEIHELVEQAIQNLQKFRADEGLSLETDLKSHVNNISSLLESALAYETERIQIVRERLQGNLEDLELKSNYNEERYEQELIYYIEKYDISEEKVRLRTHCNYFVECINAEPGQGKKLGFISQEMGREINTLGSKANHAEMQKLVVQMKDELEKIKEQVLNVL